MKPLVSDPLVVLSPEGEWSAEHDVLLRYSAAPELPCSAWDWIGLFQVMLPQQGWGMCLQELLGSSRALILAGAGFCGTVVCLIAISLCVLTV